MRKWINLFENDGYIDRSADYAEAKRKFIESKSNQYDDTVLPAAFKNTMLSHIIDYYGSFDSGYSSYMDWMDAYHDLWNKGGSIYRVMFAYSAKDLRLDPNEIGKHWSMRDLKYEEEVVERLRKDAHHTYDAPREPMKEFFVKADIPPHSITLKGINLPEEWTEFEVNVISPAMLKNIRSA